MLRRVRATFTLCAVAVVACARSEVPTAVPRPARAPAPSSHPIEPAPTPTPSQSFSTTEPSYQFADADRRRKLASAFPIVDSIVSEEMASQKSPGTAFGIVIDGELAYARGFGIADVEKQTKVDADTVFRIGSITKSFTALVALSLRDEGALSLDDPLTRFVPEAAGLVYPTRDAQPITLRQISTHTSGLPRQGGSTAHRPSTEDEVTALLAGCSLEHAPGSAYVYSNFGFGILGIAVARAGHATLRALVTQRLLEPLAMRSTVWDREDVAQERRSRSYKVGPTGDLVPIDDILGGAEEGAGGLYSSVRDLARYVAFQLAAYPPRNDPENGPIRRSTLREAHSTGYFSGLSVALASAPKKGESLVSAQAQTYGFGWVNDHTCEFDDLVWHNGAIDGYTSDISFLRDRGVGVITLQNGGSGNAVGISRRVLQALKRTGGLTKRSRALSPAFEVAMKKLLRVYNDWDEAEYHAMLRAGRRVVTNEREELAGYKELHGACHGYAPLEARTPLEATFKMDCERGPFEMRVSLWPDDGLIDGFVGLSRDAPAPKEMRLAADRLTGLIRTWDARAFARYLAPTKKQTVQAQTEFDALRSAHGTCAVRSSIVEGFDRSFYLECDRGGDLSLVFELAKKDPNRIAGYSFRSARDATCPVR